MSSTTPQTDDLIAQLRMMVCGKITGEAFKKDLNENYLTPETVVSTSTVGRWLYGAPFNGIISSESTIAIQSWMANQTKKTKIKS